MVHWVVNACPHPLAPSPAREARGNYASATLSRRRGRGAGGEGTVKLILIIHDT